jgi:hypothetical protein
MQMTSAEQNIKALGKVVCLMLCGRFKAGFPACQDRKVQAFNLNPAAFSFA